MYNGYTIGGGITASRVRGLIDQARSEDSMFGYNGLTETSFVGANGAQLLELVGAGPEVNLVLVHFANLSPTNLCDLYVQLLDSTGEPVAGYDGYYHNLSPYPIDMPSSNKDGMLLTVGAMPSDKLSGRLQITRAGIGFEVTSLIHDPGRGIDMAGYATVNASDVSGVRIYWTDDNGFLGDLGFASLSWSK